MTNLEKYNNTCAETFGVKEGQLIDLLKLPDKEHAFLEKVKDEKLPVIIFGAGEVAPFVEEFLIKNRISDYIFTCNRAFLERQSKAAMAAEDVDAKFERYALMPAMGNLPDGWQSIFKNAVTSLFVESYNIELMSRDYFEENMNELQNFYDFLQDDLSRETLMKVLRGHITRDALLDSYIFPQYFIKELPREAYKVFINCGAFTGDTLRDFDNYSQKGGQPWEYVIAFEPDSENYAKLRHFVESLGEEKASRIQTIQKGLSDKNETLRFESGKGISSYISDTGVSTIEVVTIDSITEKLDKKVTLINMDIEGAELAALQGAEKTIKRDKPALAISIYHKHTDLITIPLLLKEYVPEYKFNLRAHRSTLIDYVLYATV